MTTKTYESPKCQLPRWEADICKWLFLSVLELARLPSQPWGHLQDQVVPMLIPLQNQGEHTLTTHLPFVTP